MSWDPVSRPAGILAGTTVVNLNYDGDDLVGEYLTTGMLRRHIFAPGVDEPLLTYEGADTSSPSWRYADPLGSVVGYANASGAATYTTGFDEYGLNNYVGGRFQFTGQTWFPGATGSDLYHMKARAYSSTLGRFLQPDPILYAGGINLYAYVGNDPVNLRDPWGLEDRPPPPPGSRDYCSDGRPDCNDLIVTPGNIGNFAGLRLGGWSFWRRHLEGGGGREEPEPSRPFCPVLDAEVSLGIQASAQGQISSPQTGVAVRGQVTGDAGSFRIQFGLRQSGVYGRIVATQALVTSGGLGWGPFNANRNLISQSREVSVPRAPGSPGLADTPFHDSANAPTFYGGEVGLAAIGGFKLKLGAELPGPTECSQVPTD